MRKHLLAWLLLSLLTVAGCVRGSQPAASPENEGAARPDKAHGPSAPATEATPVPPPSEDAIAKWTAVTAASPTADHWNELSYAYLLAKRYKEAADAGDKALALKQNHPFALYNTGVAYLELAIEEKASYKLELAKDRLSDSSLLQPDRYEPHLQLARAYAWSHRQRLGLYHADQAASLSRANPEVQKIRAALQQMSELSRPDDRESAAAFTDGDLTLYLYSEKTDPNISTSYTLYVLRGSSLVQRLPIGDIGARGKWFTVTLPDGRNGYWLLGGPVGAGVAHTNAWRLFVRDGAELRQVLFPDHDSSGLYDDRSREWDFMRDTQIPEIQGDLIRTAYPSDVTGGWTRVVTRRLNLQDYTIAVVSKEDLVNGKIVSGAPSPTVSLTFGYDRYEEGSRPISDQAGILHNGKPASREILKPDMPVGVTLRKGEIVEVRYWSK